MDFPHFPAFLPFNLYRYDYKRCSLNDDISKLRLQLRRAYGALRPALISLQRSDAMVRGSFYLLRRKCGKPNCRCVSGQLHASWVLSRSEQGKDRLYSVPKEQRARLRRWAGEYRRYQRARALLARRLGDMLALADQIAEKRLRVWPEKKTEKLP